MWLNLVKYFTKTHTDLNDNDNVIRIINALYLW